MKEYQAAFIGRAVEDIYYDDKKYWKKNTAGRWYGVEKEDLKLHFQTALRGKFSQSRRQAQRRNSPYSGTRPWSISRITSVSRARPPLRLSTVSGGFCGSDGNRILNTANVLSSATCWGCSVVWGEKGEFPWSSHFFDNLFPDEHSRHVVLAWFAWFYKHAYRLEPTSGQVLFLAGPQGGGKKRFLNRVFFLAH